MEREVAMEEFSALAVCGAHLEVLGQFLQQQANVSPPDTSRLQLTLSQSVAVLSEQLRLGRDGCPEGLGSPELCGDGAPRDLHENGRGDAAACERDLPERSDHVSFKRSDHVSFNDGARSTDTGGVPNSPSRWERQKIVSRSQTTKSEASWNADQVVLRELTNKSSKLSLRALDLQRRQLAKDSWAFQTLRRLVTDAHWEGVWGICLLVNSVAMILEEEYAGIALGHHLGIYEYYGSEQHLARWWPNAATVFFGVDCVFTALFSLEILLAYSYDIWNAILGRRDSTRRPFWTNPWNFVDVAIVGSSIFMLAFGVSGPVSNARFLRIFRLVRMLRLVRLMRQVENLDTLLLMTTAIKGSLAALSYSMILLTVILTLFGMLLSQAIRFLYLGDDSPLADPVKRQLFLYFGTYTRSMVTMFELTLANWIPVARYLMEECHEIFGFVCICYKLSVGFATIGVINGVFIQETFGVAANDELIMVRSRMRQTKHKREYLQRLFYLSDQDHDGMLSKDELHYVLEKRAIRTWLEALGLSCSEGDLLFDMIADGKDQVGIEEFISGIGKLAGSAKNIDVVAVRDILRRGAIRHDPR